MLQNSVMTSRMSRQQWWTGVLILIAFLLVWSVGSEFLLTGVYGEVIATALSLVFLLPFGFFCLLRMNDLGRPALPLLPLVLAPFAIHPLLLAFANHAERNASFETGINDASAVVYAPNLLGWLALAWFVAALVWVVVVLGTHESGQPESEGAQPA